ncbi:hypothetical protein Gotri_018144 [Gossypium trilobum]|uniref:Uncharacterized protein n=2 Tax=Gossypium TaxID=3633 RepID=A0A7J9KI76_9ROSI|nr:hypothetical protein [Gossypium trilobum]MBA0846154.1 hypothetical protein [Gossypium armourianum]
MGSEEEKESSYTPKLPLFSASHAHMQSPQRSGMLTPPLHASASVPFRWEEEPGKPKPSTALTSFTTPNDSAPKCLELPPRLLLDAKIAKLSSPTTVLEGPYTGRPRFQSSSFRMGSECYGSFRASPETLQLGSMVLSKRGYKEKGFLGFWRGRSLKARPRREVSGNSCVRDSECSRDGDRDRDSSGTTSVNITTIRRIGSFPSLSSSKSHFWVSFSHFLHIYIRYLSKQRESIYEGLMQVVPWTKKGKKDG